MRHYHCDSSTKTSFSTYKYLMMFNLKEYVASIKIVVQTKPEETVKTKED